MDKLTGDIGDVLDIPDRDELYCYPHFDKFRKRKLNCDIEDVLAVLRMYEDMIRDAECQYNTALAKATEWLQQQYKQLYTPVECDADDGAN